MEHLKETNQQGRNLYIKVKDAYISFDISILPQMLPPEGYTEIVFPVDYGEGIIEKTGQILEDVGGMERGVFPGYIRYNYLPPDWVVPVQVIRAFIPKDHLNLKRTDLLIKLSESGIACTSRERVIFTTSKHLKREKPEF
ncbi:hypothetical protein AMJ51_02390 [Microgenomates bacterium DG_75]|nr:MAG: hypothetical protein AMJ51_02390 [Microgenomates bacterium DG_75]